MDNCVTPIRVCGTRWIGHLVKVSERAINKFGICLTDLKNFNKKGKKSKTKIRNSWLWQQMVRSSITTMDGALFVPADAVEIKFFELAEEYNYSCWSRRHSVTIFPLLLNFVNLPPTNVQNFLSLAPRKNSKSCEFIWLHNRLL